MTFGIRHVVGGLALRRGETAQRQGPHRGVDGWDWENPIKMDDLGVTSISGNHHIPKFGGFQSHGGTKKESDCLFHGKSQLKTDDLGLAASF